MLNVALVVAQLALGLFFLCSGGNKAFVPVRRTTLRATLDECVVKGRSERALDFLVWWVALWEFSAGLLFLALWPPATLVAVAAMVTVCCMACATDGRQRVQEWRPINLADAVADWLYLPEVLYVLLMGILAANAVTGF